MWNQWDTSDNLFASLWDITGLSGQFIGEWGRMIMKKEKEEKEEMIFETVELDYTLESTKKL